MPIANSLTPARIEAYRTRGLLHLPGLLSAEGVRRARDSILRPMARLGLWQDGAWCLDGRRPNHPDKGLSAKEIGNKHPDVEALFAEPAVAGVVDALLEGAAFDRSIYKRPQILVTLPNADRWTISQGWHIDVPRFASGRVPGVQLFAFLNDVPPRSGGTLVLAGSHRLVNDQGYVRIREVGNALRRHAAIRDVLAPGTLDVVAEYPGGPLRSGSVGEVTVELAELSGMAGDVYAMDLRVLHVTAPNAGTEPRLMATDRYLRTDVVAEFLGTLGDGGGMDPARER